MNIETLSNVFALFALFAVVTVSHNFSRFVLVEFIKLRSRRIAADAVVAEYKAAERKHTAEIAEALKDGDYAKAAEARRQLEQAKRKAIRTPL